MQTPGPLTVYCNPKAVPAQLCPPVTPGGPGIACPECGTTQCPCPGTTKFICDKNSQTCTANSIGNYSDLGNCLNACKPSPAPAPEVRYTCNTTTSKCDERTKGNFSRLADCQTDCNSPPPKFSCGRAAYKCTEMSSGNFSELADCQKECVAPAVAYECDNITRSCVPTSAGRYNNRTDCEKNYGPCHMQSGATALHCFGIVTRVSTCKSCNSCTHS